MLIRSNEDKSIFYIKTSSLIDSKERKNFTNKNLREMIKHKPRHVILDLTDCPGGQISVASHLLFLLSPHIPSNRKQGQNAKPKNDQGSIFPVDIEGTTQQLQKNNQAVPAGLADQMDYISLISGNKHLGIHILTEKSLCSSARKPRSAGTTIATVLKRKRDATIIGYSNGGSTRTACFAAPGSFKLSQTGARILIPVLCYDRHKDAAISDRHLKTRCRGRSAGDQRS